MSTSIAGSLIAQLAGSRPLALRVATRSQQLTGQELVGALEDI